MKNHLVRILAAAAAMSLAACGGGGHSGSQPALNLDDVRELTGLGVPGETAAAQRARQRDIVARADSLVISAAHSELVFPDDTLTIVQPSECSGAACELVDPSSGETEIVRLDEAAPELGEAQVIGSAQGITLVSASGRQMGVDVSALGAWMEHGSFVLYGAHAVDENVESDILEAAALGDLTDRPLTGSASWLGIMVGTPIVGEDRGDRLVGRASLNYDLAAGGLDAGFSGIGNIDRGTPHSVETVIFSDLAVGPDGTFSRGQSGTRIQGGFFGPGHAEAAGIFEHSDIVGAFGATRQ